MLPLNGGKALTDKRFLERARMDINPTLKPLRNRRDHHCFACGPQNPHGLKMTFYTDERSVYSWVTVPGHLRGWDNLIHGGVISAILDEIMSW